MGDGSGHDGSGHDDGERTFIPPEANATRGVGWADASASSDFGGASPRGPRDVATAAASFDPSKVLGSGGLRAVSRARAVSHQRAAARRAAARAAAQRRKESLQLELQWALQAEAEEQAAVAAAVADMGERLRARDRDEAMQAEAEERRALDEMDALWKQRDATVRAVLAADAAEAARQAEAAEKARVAAEAARKKAEEEAAAAKATEEAARRKKAEEEAAAAAAKEAADKVARAAEEERRSRDASRRAAAAAGTLSPPSAGGAGASGAVPKIQVGTVPKIQVAAEASKQEGELAEALSAARARVAEYSTAAAAKKERRQINAQITVHVQQIAATKRQIEQKATDIAQFLHRIPNDPQRTFAIVSLSKRILTQCDSQVSKLNRFAFALAEVAVRVAVFEPNFGVILIALLHESCVLSVPKYYPFVEGRYASDEEYFKLMGYVAAEEQGDAPDGTVKLETTDTMTQRMRGFMLFYAAYMQVDQARHPHGLPAAWAWVSRLVNKVPPNRFSATALESYLKHAGYAMHAAYRGQFGKVLDVIHREFLPALEAKDDADCRPVVSRMRTYLNERAFMKPPEGREMPVTDTSSVTRIS